MRIVASASQAHTPTRKLLVQALAGEAAAGHLALTEAVLGLARQLLELAHAAGALGTTAHGLGHVVVAAHLDLAAVATRAALGLLDVVGHLAAAAAGGVCLVVTAAGTANTLRHLASSLGRWFVECYPISSSYRYQRAP